MNAQLLITLQSGHLNVNGPLHDLPLCLELLAGAQHAMAVRLRQVAAGPDGNGSPPRPVLLLPDGSPAPPSAG